MRWQLLDRGFLPTPDPLQHCPAGVADGVEELARALPELVHGGRFREVAPGSLREPLEWDALAGDDGGPTTERLFVLFSYFASAYVHAPGLPAAERLPAPIAVPLVRLAGLCRRPPILSYASYCLHNWRRVDPASPIELGNIELLQNFSAEGDGKQDENWFILVHVDIEARAGAALTALRSLPDVLRRGDDDTLETVLARVADSLRAMNRTLARMPENCRPEVYFRKVRPYIFGFNDVVYEGCFDGTPQTYRGETGAQSSIIPTLLAALGIRHQASLLTRHLQDLLNYMPPPHRRFIEEQPSVRDRVVRLAGEGNAPGLRLKESYNSCVLELIAFRAKHFEYAVNYINKRVDNPLATGGTPYIPWLQQLLEDTRAHLL